MSTFLHRVKVLIKSVLALTFFAIFFCVTFLFRKAPAQYSRIRNEQVTLLRQLKQKVSEWRMFTREVVDSNQPVPLNCLLKTTEDAQRKSSYKLETTDSKKSKKEQKPQKRDSKKDKKKRESKKDKSLASTKVHTLIISDAQGKTVEEVHFMDEDYQEVLEYMRSKKKTDLNSGVSKLPT